MTLTDVRGEVEGFDPPTSQQQLVDEAVHILREVGGQFERPTILFSGGKDSAVVLHLAQRAFWPGKLPFTLLHVDTGHNFDSVIEFRDRMAERADVTLHVASVQDAIDAGRIADSPLRNRLQTVPLLEAITTHRFDALIGGARRDEEKARAKERVFSLRDAFGGWDPRRQRPELWRLYNGSLQAGENMRVFPLSNWTEVDVWRYIASESVELPDLYYAHEREVIQRDGMLLAVTELTPPNAGETVTRQQVRYRTVGDITCTGAVHSSAADAWSVLAEVAASRITERGATRADDRASEAAMEDRKREGYF